MARDEDKFGGIPDVQHNLQGIAARENAAGALRHRAEQLFTEAKGLRILADEADCARLSVAAEGALWRLALGLRV